MSTHWKGSSEFVDVANQNREQLSSGCLICVLTKVERVEKSLDFTEGKSQDLSSTRYELRYQETQFTSRSPRGYRPVSQFHGDYAIPVTKAQKCAGVHHLGDDDTLWHIFAMGCSSHTSNELLMHKIWTNLRITMPGQKTECVL